MSSRQLDEEAILAEHVKVPVQPFERQPLLRQRAVFGVEQAGQFGRQAAGGHLELHRVLRSPFIDYLSGPQAYEPEALKLGDPYRSRSLTASIRLHGKLWLDEMDAFCRQQPAYHGELPENFAKFSTDSLAKATKKNGSTPQHSFFALCQQVCVLHDELTELFRQGLIALRLARLANVVTLYKVLGGGWKGTTN